MKARILFAAAILLAAWYPAAGDGLEAKHSATVRLSAGDRGRGSGTVFEVSDGRVFIITNAHVATTRAMQAEFYIAGHASRPVAATTIWADPQADLAVVSVAAAELGGVLPAVVRLAPPETVLRPGDTIRSVGCPMGGWPTGFEGHVLGYDDGRIAFQPPPAQGRSGSAMVDASGRIVGVVNAQRLDRQGGSPIHGLAVPVQYVYGVYGSAQQRSQAHTAVVQMPQIPVQQFRYQLPLPGVQRRQYEDGYRQGQQCPPGQACPLPQPQSGEGVFPSMPGGGLGLLPQPQIEIQPAPYAPVPADFGAMADAMGRMADAVEAMERRDAARAEQQRQDAIRESLPLDALGAAGGAAMQRDWAGAGTAMTGPEVGAWAAGGIAALVAGAFGLKGILGVVAKLLIAGAVRMGFTYAHERFKTPERNEANKVAEDIAKTVKTVKV